MQSNAGRGSQSHHYQHHLQAFILLCWKVGGFSPGVPIFLLLKGSVLTVDIPRLEPMPEPMPEPRGPERNKSDHLNPNLLNSPVNPLNLDWLMILVWKRVKEKHCTGVHSRKLRGQTANTPKWCTGVGVGERGKGFSRGLGITESWTQRAWKALYARSVGGGCATQVQGAHSSQRVHLQITTKKH